MATIITKHSPAKIAFALLSSQENYNDVSNAMFSLHCNSQPIKFPPTLVHFSSETFTFTYFTQDPQCNARNR